MDTKFLGNLPVPIPTNFTIGSFTTGNFEPPQGQIIKLAVTKIIDEVQTEDSRHGTPPPLFGAHIKEGIAVVKDWMKKP